MLWLIGISKHSNLTLHRLHPQITSTLKFTAPSAPSTRTPPLFSPLSPCVCSLSSSPYSLSFTKKKNPREILYPRGSFEAPDCCRSAVVITRASFLALWAFEAEMCSDTLPLLMHTEMQHTSVCLPSPVPPCIHRYMEILRSIKLKSTINTHLYTLVKMNLEESFEKRNDRMRDEQTAVTPGSTVWRVWWKWQSNVLPTERFLAEAI